MSNLPVPVAGMEIDLAQYLSDEGLVLGLEDYSDEDRVIPTIKILSDKGIFEDQLTSVTYEELRGIPLCLVKQRVLFEHGAGFDNAPLCKSNDYETGVPAVQRWIGAGADGTGIPTMTRAGFTLEVVQQGHLPCEQCKLKDWRSHPDPTREAPYCNATYNFGMLVDPQNGDPLYPALISFKTTGVKPAQAYISAFKGRGQPLFVKYCTIKLTMAQNGKVTYSVPKFIEGEPTVTTATDLPKLKEYAQAAVSLQDFMRTRGRAIEEATPDENTIDLPVSGAAMPPSQPAPVVDVPVQVPVVVPVAAPVAQPAPVAPEPAPVPQPAPQPVVAAPVSIPIPVPAAQGVNVAEQVVAQAPPSGAAVAAPATPGPTLADAEVDLPF